ncbi:hypothetical protein [Dyella acidiphila]|uniref:Lipoprotein n=1 Tax=Dyella acidiphila TaxID=2775866 RepID=A0ABR9G6I8_9GAMM|nr:hypothetical protein [Dyella acidiphila]MBE1159628.1 hypothetical protein [Dyella acidiphila]
MKPIRLLPFLSIVSLSGCIFPAPAGAHYELGSFTAKPNDQCAPYYLDQPRAISSINASIGQAGGVEQRISSIDESRSITVDDARVLGIPVDPNGAIQGIACYATLHYQAGGTETGVLTSVRSDPSQPYRLTWISQQALNEARKAQGEREEMARERLQEEHQRSIAYSGYLQACTLEWKMGIEAKSLLASGEPQGTVEEDLINRHAYGPSGQVYRDSDDLAELVRRVVAAVAMRPEMRNQAGVPDYASHEFLEDCPARARKAMEQATKTSD